MQFHPPPTVVWRTYRRLLGYSATHWRMALLALIGMVVSAACMTLFAKLLKPLLDRLFIARDPHTIFWMPIWILGIFAVRGVASWLGTYGMAYVGRRVVQAIREDVFDAYLRLSDSFFEGEASGAQIARITYTCDQLARASTDAVKTSVVDGLTVIGLVVVMLYYSPVLTLALLTMVPTVALLALRVGRSYRKAGSRIQAIMGAVTSAVSDTVSGRHAMRVYAGQSRERRAFSAVTERTRRLELKLASTDALAGSVVQFIAAVALAVIVIIATRPTILAGMSPGTFFAVIMATGGIMPSLKRLMTVQASIERGLVAAVDVFDVIDAPAERDAGTLDVAGASGHLEFRQVQFTYPGSTAPTLTDISFDYAPGTLTAIIGRSGSGKTTLSRLIPRFQDPQAGAILFDGHDLRDYRVACLRRQIAWVGQSVQLFDGTIAENVAYGELAGASEAEIAAAARAANAIDFIVRLPEGLRTRVGPDAGLLSGGERQRIAIARAILKDAPILVLDEAASALDPESERLIQDALEKLIHRRTTIVIAHRLSTVRHADQIIVVHDGRVAERGTRDTLLRVQGHYEKLYRLQLA
ncbi:MAG: lipid A export permease/ATP-binding protein MsbA [Rhodanobacteraceae bacterium]